MEIASDLAPIVEPEEERLGPSESAVAKKIVAAHTRWRAKVRLASALDQGNSPFVRAESEDLFRSVNAWAAWAATLDAHADHDIAAELSSGDAEEAMVAQGIAVASRSVARHWEATCTENHETRKIATAWLWLLENPEPRLSEAISLVDRIDEIAYRDDRSRRAFLDADYVGYDAVTKMVRLWRYELPDRLPSETSVTGPRSTV